MKKIEAVILPCHLDDVRKELQRLGMLRGFTTIEVQHSDSDKGLSTNKKGAYGKFRDRIKLELIVDDSEADQAVNVILRHARPKSDEAGGQITVLEVNQTRPVGQPGRDADDTLVS